MIYAFQNAEQFKELFGKRENGSRKNLVVLNFLRDRSIHNFIRDNFFGPSDWFGIADPATLYSMCLSQASCNSEGQHKMAVLGYVFYNDKYETDGYKGICEDGDHRCIRYVNHDTGKVMKMKAGKMLKHLLQASNFGRHLGEPTVLYLCEEFARRWETHAASRLPNYHLVVDDDFRAIYDYDYWPDDANCGSCMMDDGQYTYYEDAVCAKAASLRNDDDKVIARCVIFTNVHETGSDRIWRLADRQYSLDGDELLKRLLVDALIREGYIDGYKAVGASCWDKTMYVDNEGNSLKDKDFWIRCSLDYDETLSFQDSFAFYDKPSVMAYNHDYHNYTHQLDTTDSILEDNRNWDSYHEEYTESEIVDVYYHGRLESCAEDDLDDFVSVDGTYYHEDDVMYCPRCGEPFVAGDCDSYYSAITDEDYCCMECRDRAELDYKEENWFWSEVDEDYFEHERDVTTVFLWDELLGQYALTSVSVDTADRKVSDGEWFLHEGEYFDTLEHVEGNHQDAA